METSSQSLFNLIYGYSKVMSAEFLNPSVVMDSIYGLLNRIDYQFDVRKKSQHLWDLAYAHPFWATFIIMSLAVLTVPIGAFIMFAGGTIAFTFVGFIFVEGTLLTIGAIFMIAILSVLGFISLSFAGCVFVIYFILSGGLTFLSTTSDKIKQKMNQRMHNSRSQEVSSSGSSPDSKEDYVYVKNGDIRQEGDERMTADAQKDE